MHLCFAPSHGGNHGSDLENPLPIRPFHDADIFIAYYDEPNTPYAGSPCLSDIFKKIPSTKVSGVSLTHPPPWKAATSTCCCNGCCEKRGDCEHLTISRMRLSAIIDGRPIKFKFMGYLFLLRERLMFSVVKEMGEEWRFLKNIGGYSTIYTLSKTSCSEIVGSNQSSSSASVSTALQKVRHGSLLDDQARLDPGNNMGNTMDEEIELDIQTNGHDDADTGTVTDQADTQGPKRKAGQQSQRQSSRRKRTRSTTATSRGEDVEKDDTEPSLLNSTQRVPYHQHQSGSQNLATALEEMLRQAFAIWPWAPESLTAREIIQLMTAAVTAAVAVEGQGNMDDLRKLNCELWAHLAVEATKRWA